MTEFKDDGDKIVGDGMVLYCDGSTKPTNPGFNGYGIHGFAFYDRQPKRGTGNSQQVLTSKGYVDSKQYCTQKDADPVVEPSCYVDVIGSTDIFGSNNTAELLAALTAMKIIRASNVSKATIKTDSQYVERGVNIWNASWVSNNWIKRDGKPVPNKEIWQELLSVVTDISIKGTSVEVVWVKGHTDSIKDVFSIYGNIMADNLANIGSEKAKHGIKEITLSVSKAEGYWKSSVTKSPMISHRTMYVSGASTDLKNIYFVGNHGKDDDFIGRPDPDASLAVVVLDKSEPILDLIKDFVSKKSNDNNKIAFVKLDSLYTKNRADDVVKYGINAFIQKRPDIIDLQSSDKEPILREIYPPRLALRTFENLNTLFTRLNMFMDSSILNKERFCVTDITGIFYEEKTKNKVVAKTLKSSFKVGAASVKIKAGYNKPNSTGAIERHEKDIVLSLNIDLPDRNCLKRIETLSPEVFCVTEMESEKCFRYYTIIKNKDGSIGIWAGFYSNQIYLVG